MKDTMKQRVKYNYEKIDSVNLKFCQDYRLFQNTFYLKDRILKGF